MEDMIALAGWILKIIIFCLVFKFVLKLFKLSVLSNSRTKTDKTKRFDIKNKDVTDADYKDIK
jgi:hypothetical protein